MNGGEGGGSRSTYVKSSKAQVTCTLIRKVAVCGPHPSRYVCMYEPLDKYTLHCVLLLLLSAGVDGVACVADLK